MQSFALSAIHYGNVFTHLHIFMDQVLLAITFMVASQIKSWLPCDVFLLALNKHVIVSVYM